MTQLMTDLRNAMKDALHERIKNETSEVVSTSDLLGAASWVLAELMLITEVEMDESVLKAFVNTYNAVKLAQGLDKNDSVH